MSYILDALRRADAERERGAVPGLHAQALPLAAAESEGRRGLPLPVWLGIAGALLIIALLAWRLTATDEAAPITSSPLPAQTAAPSTTATPAVPAPVAASAQPNAAPRVTVKAPPAPMPGASSARPSTTVKAQPSTGTGANAATAEPAAPPFGTAASAAVAAHAPGANELPPEVRQNLPKLAIGGSMYSESPANRMLIINGLVYHENDRITPDLTLESIQLKSAVLRYRNYRYSINY